MRTKLALVLIPALALVVPGVPKVPGSLPPAAAAVLPVPAFSGYSTGTFLHADTLQAAANGPQLVNAELAFSGASVASQGTGSLPGQGRSAPGGTIVNEMSQVVQPVLPGGGGAAKLAGDRSFARGSGLEVGLVTNLPSGQNAIPLNKVQVSAAPTATDTREIGPVTVAPLAYASLLRGQAAAAFDPSACVANQPVSMGLGYAADAQVLQTGSGPNPDGTLANPVLAVDAAGPDRAATQSQSTEVVVPQPARTGLAQVPAGLALLSETRQTLAPVTLFKGTPNEVTVEVAGEWVLQAVAGGLPGAASVVYAPAGSPTPTTPVLRTIRSGQVTNLVTFQDLLGKAGLNVPLGPLGEITIAEQPRAIGGAFGSAPTTSADGTLAAAAVDVVRIKLLEQLDAAGNVVSHAADLRIGHMEARAQVPVGGVVCANRIPVTKTANPDPVVAGQQFAYTIRVDNPFDCTLTGVKVVDTITASTGVAFSILSSAPPANATGSDNLVWNDIGPIAPHTAKTLRIDVAVPLTSAPGRLTDTVVVTASCGLGSGSGGAQVTVPLTGQFTLEAPRVTPGPGGTAVLGTELRAPAELPRTGGGLPSLPVVGGLLGLGLAVRRRLLRPAGG